MKEKFVFLNFMFSIVVLFSILFQSMHNYEHLVKQLSEKRCDHAYNSSHEITHQHHSFDRCFVCNFALSSFVFSDISHFEFKKIIIASEYSFFRSREIAQFFKGSLFSLRAPPVFIV